MKSIRIFSVALAIVAFVATFTACSDTSESKTHIVVGATPVPAAEILEYAKPFLEAQGIEMSVRVFTDYITPNIALNSGELDANLYQHKPFMELQNQKLGFKLQALSPIYVVPLGFYSQNFKSADELQNGAQIALPADSSNLARALILLHDNGVIELKDPKNPNATIESDIISNPKNLNFRPMEAAILPKILDQVDAAIINANYAIQAGMKINDSIFHETQKSEYVNVLVANESNKENEAILKLQEVLLSKEVAKWIAKKYGGDVLSVTQF